MEVTKCWNSMLPLLKDEVSPLGYNTWMMTIEPVSINKNKIYLKVPSDFNKGILETRYMSLIKNTVKQVLNKELEPVFILPSQNVESFKENSDSEETEVSLFLNPKYTFDTFVIG